MQGTARARKDATKSVLPAELLLAAASSQREIRERRRRSARLSYVRAGHLVFQEGHRSARADKRGRVCALLPQQRDYGQVELAAAVRGGGGAVGAHLCAVHAFARPTAGN